VCATDLSAGVFDGIPAATAHAQTTAQSPIPSVALTIDMLRRLRWSSEN
jgi:hypothetical protein